MKKRRREALCMIFAQPSSASLSLSLSTAQAHFLLIFLSFTASSTCSRVSFCATVSHLNSCSENHSGELFLCSKVSPFCFQMERFFAPELNSARILGNSQKIDLTLKLSLGGHGVQNSDEKFLARSSSIGGKIRQNGVEKRASAGSSVVLPLERSCSLPAGAEKRLMRFGDLQTMRRAETGKRLLMEKQRRLALAAAAEKEERTIPPEMFALKAASVSKSPALCRAIDTLKALKNPSGDSKHEGPGGGLAEAGASSNHQTHEQNIVIPETVAKETPKRPAETMMPKDPRKKVKVSNPFTFEGDSMEILKKMPTVTTTGPNGKKIEGFLYKYLKGQVSIVCVCHGSFLTPAEFVKHAGGGETANPMKHINVHPGSF